MARIDDLTAKLAKAKPNSPEWHQLNSTIRRLSAAGNTAQGSSQVVNPKLKLDKAGQVINTTFDVSRAAQQQGNLLTNPNQFSNFGSQTTTIDPVTGQPAVWNNLSPENAAVLKGIQGGAQGANNQVGQIFGGGNFFGGTDASGHSNPTSSVQQGIYEQLTHGFADQQKRDSTDLEQQLANRGIPVGSELYNDQKKQLADRYDTKFGDAKSQAVTQGTQLGIQGAQTFSGIGQQGFYQPQFSGFNAVQYAQPDVNSVFQTLTGKKIADAGNNTQLSAAQIAANAALEAARIKGAGGGGGNSGNQGSSFGSGPPGSG